MRRIRTVCLIGSSGRPALALGLAIVFLSTLTARAEYRSLPIRHVPHAVVNGRAPYVSLLPETQKLKLAVMISMRDQAGLNAYLKEAYNPQSPSFHRWLSVSEFADRFGPSEADYQAVVAFAEANGMTIKNTEPGNRMVVDIEASVADINRTFHVAMGTYKHPTEDRTFFAPDREPTVDLTVPLWKIGGLNDYSPPRSHLQFHKQGDKVTSKQTGSGPNGQFLGSDMRSAYYGGTALTGAGQTLGLFEFGGYNVSDVQLYFSTIGQPLNVPISNVLLDGNTVNCGSACSGDGEQVIDIEQAISMAPGAAGMIVYVGSSDVDILNAMASDNKAKQMSCSFGWGDDPSSDDPIFKEFAAQGQNFFVGTTDSGALTGDNDNDGVYPADDAYTTAVGGTDLNTNGAGGSWQSETAWSGSGGGPSDSPEDTPITTWQKLSGVINSSNGGSTTLRNVPDISAEADTDNFYCSTGTCQEGVGGVSLAGPRWNGFLALVNEQLANNGKPSLGFINPAIYAIGTSSSYDSDFHDITSGNNNNGEGQSFNAVTGYDLVTGWGSPNGQALINALAGGGSSCTPTAITPYISVSGAWTEETSATVASGTTVDLGPQPNSGGSWSWTGPNGFTSTSREIDSIPLSTGANVYTATYTNPSSCKSTQAFTITLSGSGGTLIANGTYVITSVHSGQALDDPGFSNTDGQAIEQYTVNDGTNQQWKVNNLGSNVITLTNVSSGQLLDVAGASKANGAIVDQWPANGGANQQWNVISVGGGAYELTSVNSGEALDVDGASTTAGAAIDQYPYQGNSWQQWIFTSH